MSKEEGTQSIPLIPSFQKKQKYKTPYLNPFIRPKKHKGNTQAFFTTQKQQR